MNNARMMKRRKRRSRMMRWLLNHIFRLEAIPFLFTARWLFKLLFTKKPAGEKRDM
jgi:hypothetical protein